jgi:hypothetical protein
VHAYLLIENISYSFVRDGSLLKTPTINFHFPVTFMHRSLCMPNIFYILNGPKIVLCQSC